MKKLIMIISVLAVAFVFTACGGSAENEEDTSKEIVLVAAGESIDDGSFHETAWKCIEAFCSENEITCDYCVMSNDDAGDPSKVQKAVDKAVDNGGKLFIFTGGNFENDVYELQSEYKDVDFALIDGVPNNGDGKYRLSDNSSGILFAEEEAGYLAGYAAVVEGYKKIGFMGGEELPAVKRYGYGFVQGIAAAARDNSVNGISVNYKYEGTFDPTDAVRSEAEKWYKDGTEVIFACGGSMGKSVIKAAEKNGGYVIGVDADQSGLSDVIITSAKKGIPAAIEDLMKEYRRGNFIGNNVYNYSAANDGVSLEMDNSKLDVFSSSDYKNLLNKMKKGELTIKKDTDVETVEDFADDNVKINLL